MSGAAAVAAKATKPLQRAPLWLGAWWAGIALVVLYSLLPARDLPPVFPGGDKLEHALSYCALAAFAVQLFTTRAALRAAAGLVALGIAMELAQGAFTSTRSMDAWDALANTLGVLAGVATLATPLRDLLLRYDGRA